MKNKKNIESGQSMFEVILALFIITMIIVAIVILSTNAISNSLFSRSKTQASRYSQEAIEWIRREREDDSAAFAVATSTTDYCLNTLSFANTGVCGSNEKISNTIFEREVNFQTTIVPVGVTNKTIITATVVTSWQDAKGYHEARSVTDFSDIREN